MNNNYSLQPVRGSVGVLRSEAGTRSRKVWVLALIAAGATVLHPTPAATADAAAGAAPSNVAVGGNNAEPVEEIIITGSLIPQIDLSTVSPVIVITAKDLQVRGFTDIADALQQSSLATGSVENGQNSFGFTQGAKTLSMFGLNPGYVKYLIDGVPMSDYPALYDGNDTFTSIDGIPMAMVDHIDVLPGGQSSLYGSDAIAGVVNVVMKKRVDGLQVNARYGVTKDGGGRELTLAIANSFQVGKFDLLAGAQYNHTTPIWGYQRPLTDSYFASGTSPQTAERDYLIVGTFGPTGDGTNAYHFQDPQNCAGVAFTFGGSVALRSREDHGQYCGTFRSGFYTIANGDKAAQILLRGNYAFGNSSDLYADLLLSNGIAQFSGGTGTFNTDFVTNQYTSFYDPRFDDFMTVQHIFAPEETEGLDSTMSDSTTNLVRITTGVRGPLGASAWTYDLSFSSSTQRLKEHTFTQLTDPLVNFYAPMLGANLGPDPYGFGLSTFQPNYADLYRPVAPAQFAGFSGFYDNHSKTEDNLLRAQVTDSALWLMRGGHAGLALVVEGAHQSWMYEPDAGLATNQFFGFTSTGGSNGARNRYALTAELRLPILTSLTADLSGRFDTYKLTHTSFDKATAMFGLEYRPLKSLLVRGRAGTAFKAPTLSDAYLGTSGFYIGGTDYYACALAGYTPATLANCPYPSAGSVFGQTSGNPALKPINANVWSAGLAFAPQEKFNLSVDYLHWDIKDEVATQDPDQVLQTEAACRLGTLDAHSPTCVAALSQVTRDSNGQLVSVFAPKINIAEETLDTFVVSLAYGIQTGRFGAFEFQADWNDMLKHSSIRVPGDTPIDLLNDPFWSTEFKSKINASITWQMNGFSTTVYGNRVGHSPNYLATVDPAGYATPGAAKLRPWTLINLQLGYRINTALDVSLSAINVFNQMPPLDRSYSGLTSTPFNIYNYSNYGASYRIELRYGAL